MTLPIVKTSDGRIQFAGFTRGCDEAGAFIFVAELAGHSPVYGSYTYAEIGETRTFSMEVINFGYTNTHAVNSTNMLFRNSYLDNEIERAERLCVALFTNKDATAQDPMFSGGVYIFNGEVKFYPNWIVKKSR